MRAIFSHIQLVLSIGICLVVTSCQSAVVPLLKSEIGTSDEGILTPNSVDHLNEVVHFDFGDQVPVAGLAFSANSSRLTVVHLSYKLRNLNVISHTLISEFSISPVSMGTTAFDRDAGQVVVISGQRLGVPVINELADKANLRVWDTQTGRLIMDSYLRRFPGSFPLDGPTFLTFMPDGKRFIYYDGGIAPWDIATDHPAFFASSDMGNESEPKNYAYSSYPHGIAIDPEGIYLAEGRGSGMIFMTQLNGHASKPDDYKTVAYLKTPGFGQTDHWDWDPNALSFSPDRHWLAVAAKKHLFVLDLNQGAQTHLSAELSATDQVSAVAFDPSGRLLVHGSSNGWQVWDMENKKLLREDTSVPVSVVAFSPNGRYMATGDTKGVVRIWGVK